MIPAPSGIFCNKMKIHFFGSLAGNKMRVGNKTHYEKIVETIEELGYGIITKHAVYKNLEDVLKESMEDNAKYIERMKDWIRQADIVVVETTKPEIGTGYELALAISENKPVIALYTDGQNSPILAGQVSLKIQHIEYDLSDLKSTLRDALEMAKDQMDIRFTMLLSPKIVTFLNKISKKKRNSKISLYS